MIDASFQAYLEDLLPLQGIESDNPDVESDELALTVVNRLTPKQRRQLLLKVIAAAFDSVRADRLRQAQEAQRKKEDDEFYGGLRREWDTKESARHVNDPWNAGKSSSVYMEWAGQSDEVRAQQRAAADSEYARYLASRGDMPAPTLDPAARFEREFVAWQKEQAVREFEQRIRLKVKLELTAELLAKQFVGSKGTRISWGNATAEDHLTHMRTLLEQAGDTAVVAKKHAAAIDLLTKHQVGTLNEVRKATTKKAA